VEACVKVSVERTDKSEAVLNVELDWTELESASNRAFPKLARRYNVPGFRPGKAPRSMLERMLGKEAIYQNGLETLIEESYRDAIRENQLVPLAEPTLDAPPLQLNEPYSYTARVPVLSPVTLGDYHGVKVDFPQVEVTDEDVDKVLADLQQQHAVWLPTEEAAQLGHHVIVDLKLTVGDRTISDLHDNEFELAETREGVFSGMDAHLIGMKDGESKEFTTTIPEDYTNTELAGQEAHYTVAIKGVKYHETPEVDDELAKSVGEFETVAALRAGIREQLTERREANAERDFRDQLLKAITDQAEVEIHPVLVEDETGVMVREMQRMLEQSGLTLEQFFSATNTTEADYRKQIEPEARERVKRDLVLDAIANAEGVQAGEAEQQAWLSMLSAMGGQQLRLRELSAGQRQHVVNRVRRDKVVAQLVEAAGGHAHHHHDHDHDHDHEHADEGEEASVTSALSAAIEAEELEREIEAETHGTEQPPTAATAAEMPAESAPESEA
jgi:trigger factor